MGIIMEQTKNQDASNLKKEIHNHINRSNVAQTDKLVNKLWKLEHENEEIRIPDNFVKTVIREGKRGKEMKMRNMMKVAAAFLILAGSVSTTVYAAANHFKNINITDYGMAVSDSTSDEITITEDEKEPSPLNTQKIREEMEAAADMTQIVGSETGTASDKWIKKITSIDETPLYQSDDRVNWTKDTEHKGTLCVEYQYQTVSDALTDNNFPNIIGEGLQKYTLLSGYATYREFYPQQQDQLDHKEVTASFNVDGGGSAALSVSWTYMAEDVAYHAIIGGTSPALNGRTYTAADSTVYTLSDYSDNGSGKPQTIAMVSSGSYTLTVVFQDMTENNILKVLDDIYAYALIH